MPLDRNKVELKPGDKVKLDGEIVHAHADLVTVRLLAPQGQYEPQVTMAPGMMEKLQPPSEAEKPEIAPEGGQENAANNQ